MKKFSEEKYKKLIFLPILFVFFVFVNTGKIESCDAPNINNLDTINQESEQKSIFQEGMGYFISPPISHRRHIEPRESTVKRNAFPQKIGASEEQNKAIHYAWEKSDSDPNFIFLIEVESGWILDAYHINYNNSTDHGLCQLNNRYHQEFINSDYFNEWEAQINYCFEVYRQAKEKNKIQSVFHAYKNINKAVKNFEWLEY